MRTAGQFDPDELPRVQTDQFVRGGPEGVPRLGRRGHHIDGCVRRLQVGYRSRVSRGTVGDPVECHHPCRLLVFVPRSAR